MAFYSFQLAPLLGVHPRTITRWIAAGYLPAVREGKRGSRLMVRWRDIEGLVSRTSREFIPGGRWRRIVQGLAKRRECTGWLGGRPISWRNREPPKEWVRTAAGGRRTGGE